MKSFIKKSLWLTHWPFIISVLNKGKAGQYKDENLDLDESNEIPSESKRDGGDKQSFQFKFFHSVAPHNFKIYFEHFLKEQQQLHQ